MKGLDLVRDGVRARRVGLGLIVEHDGAVLIVDAPDGIGAEIRRMGVATRVAGIVLTGGRLRSIGGLVALLGELDVAGLERVVVFLPMGEDRAAALCDAWVPFADRLELTIDTEGAGAVLELGPFRVVTNPIRRAEVRDGAARAVSAIGVRIAAGGVEVAFVPGAAPGAVLERLCRGADLAVVEVGTGAFPATDEPWRLTSEQAIAATSSARAALLFGSDGEALGVGDES